MSVPTLKGDAFAQAFLAANATNAATASAAASAAANTPTADAARNNEASKKKKAIDAAVGLYQRKLNEDFEKYIASTSPLLSSPKAKGYLESTRCRILEGASHLTKDSVVVILGPQFISAKNEPVEPIKELSARCKQVILVDFDAPTLALIRSKINCSNVTCQLADLSGGAYEEGLRIGVEALQEQPRQRDEWYIGKYIEWLDSYPFNDRISKLVDKILPSGIKADYVVSSLVASEIGALVERLARFTTKEILKKDPFPMPRVTMMALMSALDRNKKMFVTTHLDLLFNLIKPQGSGKIYFADTTKIEKDSRGPMAAASFALYNTLTAVIDGLKCRNEKRSWTWENPSKTWRVDSWMLSSISDDVYLSFPRVKAARLTGAGTAADGSASVPTGISNDNKDEAQPAKASAPLSSATDVIAASAPQVKKVSTDLNELD